jgi:universal stress protein A
MLTVRSILCPVDFSEQSRRALQWASAIAQHRGGQLTVLSVVEPLLAQAAKIRLGIDLTAGTDPALREFVEATVPERVRQASQIRMQLAVGNPSDVILETAASLKPWLIVMGTHGLGGFRKLLFGSSTEQVLRRTEWPVLAVPGGAAPAVEDAGVQLKVILLATDFRESAMAATQWAADLASDLSLPLVLAHVVEPVVVPPRWQALVADFDDERVRSGQRMLTRLSATLRDTDNDSVVSVGPPADTIASLAREHQASLVIMGLARPDDSELHRPGSIAYRLLRIAHIAVVVVPALHREPPTTKHRAGVSGESVDHLAAGR